MIAICVGHSRGDGGAVSVGGVNEWHFNKLLARDIREILTTAKRQSIIVDRYAQTGYTRAMTLLANSLASQGVKVAVELHFNSGETAKATGHEWLHWSKSVPGRALAQALQTQMVAAFPEHKSRGLIGIASEKDRGGGFLRRVKCPAVICEPFFGSNPADWDSFETRREVLAAVIADGILTYLKGGRK